MRLVFFFSSRRRHTRCGRDWSSDVCSSDLVSAKDEVTTQYEMTDLEKVGVLKMDFLALNTLTIISDCLKSIKRMLNEEIAWAKISLNDEKTMQLFSEGRTDAIFQFESSGMQEICRKLRPN